MTSQPLRNESLGNESLASALTSTASYPKVDPNPDFAAIEEQVLKQWKQHHTFETSVTNRPEKTADGSKNAFVFYDGPPFANGLPHYGHLLTGFVKDLFARYQTMKGKRTERRFGWDCHGLPAEMGAEKELGISGRQQIQNFGIEKFNEHCRSSVMKYAHEWEHYVTRQARWVDFANDYKTMNRDYMESVLWAFKQLYEKGLVYESHRVMPYSWAAETPLSNFETKLDNSYRQRIDKAVTVKFKLKEKPKGAPEAENYYVLAWTTTPWTLPSNLALAVGKDLEYVCVPSKPFELGRKTKNFYILAEQSMGFYSKELDFRDVPEDIIEQAKTEVINSCKNQISITKEFPILKGSELLNLSYEPLFPYFKDTPNAFRILDGSSFITEGEGTGIVHMAPGFGEDDQKVCAANGIEVVVPVDESGRYTDAIFDIPPTLQSAPAAGLQPLPLEGGANNTPSSGSPLEGEQGGHAQSVMAHRGGYREENITHARAMRKEPTEAENKLWQALKRKQLDVKFRRQQPIGNYIADYFSSEARLIVEVDGGQHAENQKEYDERRTAFFESAGYRVLRFWNDAVLQNLEGVLETIQQALQSFSMLSNGASLPSPLEGEQLSHAQSATANRGGYPPLSLKGLNVVADKRKSADEPYTDKQLEQYGLANLRIINWLKQRDLLVKQEDYPHNYPHCWRTDTPLIYRALPSWYVKVTAIRDRAVELNKQINWIPEHIRDGQMGHMLATAPDWSISRNRFWGTPIPIWKSDNPQNDKLYVFGSIAELEEFFGQKVEDLHRPYIDNLTKPDPENPAYTLRRVTDVFDCWFESGSMPFAQVHYPFENKEWFEQHFPADFITEYVGQTRGWFNTLIILATALFDRPPFKNCICHGVVLDAETGLKYSKRLKNYKDPLDVIGQFGADALRWLMIASPVMRGQDLMVDPEGKFIRDVVRLYIKPIWNAYNYFCLYANSDGIQAEYSLASTHVMDQYILSKMVQSVRAIETALDGYDTPTACQSVVDFFETLNNWYIRRNKERFWKAEKDADKQQAYNTLYTVLHTLCRAAAPLLPLVTEAIYQGLTVKGEATAKNSVHLADFPRQELADFTPDETLIRDMDRVRDICNTALSIRNVKNLRVRLPLNKLQVVAREFPAPEAFLYLIEDEVNVKRIELLTNIDEFATRKLQVNLPKVGAKLGGAMKQIMPAVKQGQWSLTPEGKLEIVGHVLEPDEFTLLLEVNPQVKGAAQPLASNDALVILDTEVTPELEAEGIARDVVRLIQQSRKEANLEVSDRIQLVLHVPASFAGAMEAHRGYIAEQTLANSFSLGDVAASAFRFSYEVDGATVQVGITPSH